MLPRRAHLRAVEPRRSVDAAVADEHDVVLVAEAARGRELHVGDAGAALEAEDRDTRVCRMGTNPRDRKCDQARVRIVAVLGHDERPAIRGGGAVLGRVVAALERQLAGMRAGRHGDGLRAAGEVEVAEREREEGDQGEAGDPAASEAFRRRFPLPLPESGWSCNRTVFMAAPCRGFCPRWSFRLTAPPRAMDPAGVRRWRSPASRWCV